MAELSVTGWKMVFYQWHEDTGMGEFVYRRGPESKTLTRSQPSRPGHDTPAPRSSSST